MSPWRGAEVGSVPPAPHRCGEVQRLFAKEGGAAATKGGAAFGFGAEGCSAAGEECADRRQQEPATRLYYPAWKTMETITQRPGSITMYSG